MRSPYRLCLLAYTLLAVGCDPVIDKPAPPPPPAGTIVLPTAAPIRESKKPPIVLPSPPPLTPLGSTFLLSTKGYAMVLEFETGGRSGYNDNPEWPGASSGVTIGIGYDLGYFSKKVIESDWQRIAESPLHRLSATAGITGQKAKAKVATLQDIMVQWELATNVFQTVDVAREYASAKHAMPGFEDLRPNAQAALISLGFNRGWAMNSPNREEMRAIRALVPKRDYEGIAIQLRKMVHVWAGTSIYNGMLRRRNAEASLTLLP